MKKVLVIGANSYIGMKFYEYVNSLDEKKIEADMVSLSDGSWKKVDFSLYDSVLHLSAIVHKKEKKSMKEFYEEVNHKLSVEVACRAKAKNVKQFIFMSTAAVYGNYMGCITKSTEPQPCTYYGKSKLAAEKDISKLGDDNFRVAILRPPMIYGEGCKGNYSKIKNVAKFLPVFINYHNKRSVLHIDTLCLFLEKVIEKKEGGFFYPQDEIYLDTCELIRKIRGDMKKRTYFIKGLNDVVKLLIKHFILFRKVFGDLYYEKDLACENIYNYHGNYFINID